MIVAGIGCKRGTTVEEVEAAIDAALAAADETREAIEIIATSDGKGSETGIIEAAAARGVQLVLVKPAALEAAGPRTQSSSPRV
ncbi:MAG: cobalamin biosynthesis protein, partial [Methyloceanibacter sp.]